MKHTMKWHGITAMLAVIGFLATALSLTGCPSDDNGGGGTHTHSYSAAWSKNATQHWRECSCGDKTDVANHTGDPCAVCGYASGSSGGGTILDGEWREDHGSYYSQIALDGNNWEYSTGPSYSKRASGTWTSAAAITAGSTGTLTLTATWHASGTPSPATVTTTYTLNVAGNELILSNPSSTQAPWWDALPGTYLKASGGGNAITYTATADSATNTTAINLAFSAAVSGLTADEITVTNGTGTVTKGTLTGSGTSWSLGVTVTTAGSVTVSIAKSGIESGTKPVTVAKGASGTDDLPIGTPVTTGESLADKLQWLTNNAETNGAYLVEVTTAYEDIGARTLTYTGRNNIAVRLRGSGASARVVEGSFTVPDGVTLIVDNNITLDGSTGSVVTVNSGGKLIVNTGAKITGATTYNTNYGRGVSIADNGNFTMYGGEISGNESSGVSNAGTFTMNDGTISGNNVGVSNSGTFTMNNGKISGNTATYGGGVSNSGTFTMNNGEISNNTGRGVETGGTFIMNNGKISGNSGGVELNSLNSTFTMNGGEISGNTASGYGGGVYVRYGTFTMNNGKISGNTALFGGGVSVSGSTFIMTGGEISGNRATSSSEGGGGVYVASGGSISGTFYIVAGTVYGSAASPSSLRNTASNGAALYRFYSNSTRPVITQRGTFSGTTWSSKGDLYNTNDTIKVANGDIVP